MSPQHPLVVVCVLATSLSACSSKTAPISADPDGAVPSPSTGGGLVKLGDRVYKPLLDACELNQGRMTTVTALLEDPDGSRWGNELMLLVRVARPSEHAPVRCTLPENCQVLLGVVHDRWGVTSIGNASDGIVEIRDGAVSVRARVVVRSTSYRGRDYPASATPVHMDWLLTKPGRAAKVKCPACPDKPRVEVEGPDVNPADHRQWLNVCVPPSFPSPPPHPFESADGGA